MDADALAQYLMSVEGLRLEVYYDSRHHKTVGYGHLLKAEDHPPPHISREYAYALLVKDIKIAIEVCERIWPTFYQLPDNWLRVLQVALTSCSI